MDGSVARKWMNMQCAPDKSVLLRCDRTNRPPDPPKRERERNKARSENKWHLYCGTLLMSSYKFYWIIINTSTLVHIWDNSSSISLARTLPHFDDTLRVPKQTMACVYTVVRALWHRVVDSFMLKTCHILLAIHISISRLHLFIPRCTFSDARFSRLHTPDENQKFLLLNYERWLVGVARAQPLNSIFRFGIRIYTASCTG